MCGRKEELLLQNLIMSRYVFGRVQFADLLQLLILFCFSISHSIFATLLWLLHSIEPLCIYCYNNNQVCWNAYYIYFNLYVYATKYGMQP